MSEYMRAEELTWVGHSTDGRTNRWRVKCPHCHKEFYPGTTYFARRVETCNRCGKECYCDYNSVPDK